MNLAHSIEEEKKMQTKQNIDYQKQIEEALKRAKDKKVLYFYDDLGYKRLLGVFNKKIASQIKSYLRKRRLLNRLTEFDIRTTEPDSSFLEAIRLINEYSASHSEKNKNTVGPRGKSICL